MAEIEPPAPGEERFKGVEDYDKKMKTRAELAKIWNGKVQAGDRVFKNWADRFRVEMLYQYYEGFQWFFETDENNRPYVINMVYSTIETKLPNLIFDNPQFSLRARPKGLTFDEESANASAQSKEDALNFVCSRPSFGISDKHELATLDSFFGFGIMEVDYSEDPVMNPYIPMKGKPDVLDYIYCKQIPYDTFRVSASANWDLSNGKWYGYYEFIPYERLKKYKDKLKFDAKPYSDDDEVAAVEASTGKITIATESNSIVGPAGTCKIWKIWDFENGKFILYAPDDATAGDSILEYKSFDYSTLSFLRFGKRRKGWYPYPPVWNWISPQDELNDSRQAQRLHRKRFSRKYLAKVGAFESEEELDKLLYGPDGSVIKVLDINNAIKAMEDAPLDPVSVQSLGLTYDDFNRISGTPDEQRGVPVSGNRTTATQAGIMDRRSQIREAKDALRVADFLVSIGRNILRALRQVKEPFWVKSKLNNENLISEVKSPSYQWKIMAPPSLKDEDFDLDLNVTSVSPISAQQDKQAFMEFLAVLTQYEILAFSPALLREAAYRVGYKNEAVLSQFQQMAQLAAIGRLTQLNQAAGMTAPGQNGPQPTQPGQLAQQQTDISTPPDNQQIMNMVFNKQGVQQPQ